jgi:hypothetical protein
MMEDSDQWKFAAMEQIESEAWFDLCSAAPTAFAAQHHLHYERLVSRST